MKLTYLALPVLVVVGTMAFAQQPALTDAQLSALDSNGDGSISKSEYDSFKKFAFDKMDKDASGSLSPDEVDDHVAGDAFDILDDDGDGAVSPAEFSAQMDEDFGAADKDGDGILN